MNWIRPELKGMYRPLERVGHLSCKFAKWTCSWAINPQILLNLTKISFCCDLTVCYEDALFVFGGWNGDPAENDLFEGLLRYDPGIYCVIVNVLIFYNFFKFLNDEIDWERNWLDWVLVIFMFYFDWIWWNWIKLTEF